MFFGEGLCRKELRGFTPAIQAKASTALSSSGRNRADGAILSPSGDAKTQVYVGFTSDFFRRHSFFLRWPLSGAFSIDFGEFFLTVRATETGPHTYTGAGAAAMRNRPRTGQNENKGNKQCPT